MVVNRIQHQDGSSREREREMCECDLKRDKETENYVIDSILCGRGKHTEREKINTCDIERERVLFVWGKHRDRIINTCDFKREKKNTCVLCARGKHRARKINSCDSKREREKK